MQIEKKWYNMTAADGARVAELNLFGEIGWEVNAAAFAADLKSLGELDAITLRINSPGGSITEGTAIFNTILRNPAKVTAYVEGWAASMASVIAMAADEIIIPENAWMVIHNPWTGVMGEAEDLRKEADLLDRMKETIIEAYMRHAKVGKKEIVKMMDAETWMNGKEAVKLGFATRTSEAVKAAACLKNPALAKMPEPAAAIFDEAEAPSEPPAETPEPEPAPVEPPAPEPEPAKQEDQPAPDPEKETLAAENARLAGELAKAMANLDAANKDRAELSTQLIAARNQIADNAERLKKFSAGFAATPDKSSNNSGPLNKWRALVNKHGYTEARNKFPEDFANFMANAKKNLP